ncbi:MAG: PaaI family thioesterase [Acidobacteriota bacterium]
MITPELTDEQRQRAANTLHDLPFSKLIGMRLIDVRYGEAVIGIEMRDELRQPGGVLHGGVTATLIDTAMAFAALSMLEPGERTTTVDLTVHYLRPLVSGHFVCTAKTVRAGKRIFTMSAEVVSDEKKLIATALSTYTKI